MLVLSRKVGEKILIGDDIAVTVVRVSGGGIRIGIEAPTEVPVLRGELAELPLDSIETESPDGNYLNPTETNRKVA